MEDRCKRRFSVLLIHEKKTRIKFNIHANQIIYMCPKIYFNKHMCVLHLYQKQYSCVPKWTLLLYPFYFLEPSS